MPIYFAQCDKNGPIKIGYTNGSVNLRISVIQTSCPYKLKIIKYIHGDVRYEKKIHRDLDEYRMHGEWFSPHPYVLESIEKYNDDSEGNVYNEDLYLSTMVYELLKQKMDMNKLIAIELGISYKKFMQIKKRKDNIPLDVYKKIEKLIGKKRLKKNVSIYRG